MLNYFKSFFATKEKTDEQIKNTVVKYHYELKVNWYSNFMKFTTKIKESTFDKEVNIYEILQSYIPQYNKLTIPERLIDYLYRTRTGMFADNFKSGVYHISSLQLIKGSEFNTGKIIYDHPITEAGYTISFEINAEREWEIV